MIVLLCSGGAFGFLILTCYSEKYKKYHFTAKALTSIGFVGIALLSAVRRENSGYFFHIAPALFLSFFGDLFLACKSNNEKTNQLFFLLGLASFLSGHIAFVAGLNSILKFSLITAVVPLLGILLAISTFQLKQMEVGAMKLPVIAYSYFVTMLLVKCGEIIVNSGLNRFTGALLAGSYLFLFLILYYCLSISIKRNLKYLAS